MKKMRLLNLSCLITCVFLIPILLSCLKNEPLKIAYVGSLTGRYSEIGISSRNAIVMAVEEWNQKGGINRRKIKLTVADDLGIVDSAIKVDERLIKDGNKFIIGHLTSNMVPAIFNNKNSDVLFVSPTMSTSQLTIEGDNFIRAIPPCSYQSKLLAEAVSSDKIKKLFIIFDSQNSIYTKDVMENFVEYIKNDNPAFHYEVDSIYKPTAKMFSAKALNIVKANPEGVLIITNGIDFANLAQQLRRLKYTGMLYGPRWASTKDVITHGGKSVEGAVFTAGNQSDKITSNKNPFYERYKTLYGRKPINFIPVFAYDAANILFEGIEKAEEITPVAVRNSILNISKFNGVDEEIVLDRYGDASRSITLIKVENGMFVNAKN